VPAVPVQPGLRHRFAEIGRVIRGETRTHAILRSRLVFLFVTTLSLDLVATILVYLFERHAPNSDIQNVGDAFFWVSAQLTTVSSQMTTPLTTAGRMLDIVLEVWAISVVAMLAGSLASFFRTRHVEDLLEARPQQG
jgi:hypothetical protein